MPWIVGAWPRALEGVPPEIRLALDRQARRLRREPWTQGGRLRPEDVRRGPAWMRELPNLYRLRALPDGWRALYFIGTADVEPSRVVIVWCGTHKAYDRLLGHRTS